MKSKIAILALFAAAAGAIVWFQQRRGSSDGAPSPKKQSVEISVLYSTEKKDWIEAMIAEFGKVHPEVTVTLVGKGSVEAAEDILDDKLRPTLWSPADSVELRLAMDDWQTKTKKALFPDSGDDAPAPLVITPLVFAIWQDRADVLQKAAGGAVGWKALEKAISQAQGWPAIGGKDVWGFVKLGHTNPTRSNSGLQALLNIAFEYYGKRTGIQVADLLKPDFQEFVKSIERGVTKFETSTGIFMTDMIRFGPSKYDIAWVYESLAISQLENAQGRWGDLKVYYPAVTMWSDHPCGVVAGDWVTEPQRKAARLLLAFLRAKPQQELALAYGFRPADPSVPVKTTDPKNPFVRLAPYGISVDVPPAGDIPDVNVIRNVLMMWARVVGTK